MGCMAGKDVSAAVYESCAAAKSPRLKDSVPALRCLADVARAEGETEGIFRGGALGLTGAGEARDTEGACGFLAAAAGGAGDGLDTGAGLKRSTSGSACGSGLGVGRFRLAGLT